MPQELIHLMRFLLFLLQLRSSLGIHELEIGLNSELDDGVITIPWKSYSDGELRTVQDTHNLLIEGAPWTKLSENNEHYQNRRGLNEDYLDRMMMSPKEWIEDALLWHNKFRKRHDAKPLELDYKLCYEAEEHAVELAERSEYAGKLVLEHTKNLSNGDSQFHANYMQIIHGTGIGCLRFKKPLGENVAARAVGSRVSLMALPGAFVVQNWYKELKHHDWKMNFYQTNTGHFTQLIWGATKTVGCGRAVSQNAILIVVCRYVPAGNYAYKEAYKSHVKPPLDGKNNIVPDFKTI